MKPRAICCLVPIPFLLACLCLLPNAGLSAEEASTNSSLAGVWKWTFTMPDGSQVSPRLQFKEEGGALKGTTRFRPGLDAPITNLTVNGSDVSFEVARERDGRTIVTRYTGSWTGNHIKGKMVSDWN